MSVLHRQQASNFQICLRAENPVIYKYPLSTNFVCIKQVFYILVCYQKTNFVQYRSYTITILFFVILFFHCRHGDQKSFETLKKGSVIPSINFLQCSIGTNQTCSYVLTRRVYHFLHKPSYRNVQKFLFKYKVRQVMNMDIVIN